MTEAIEPMMKPVDVKTVLNCSRPKVYKLAAEGILPCVRVLEPGNKKAMLRFKKSDVLAFIEKHYQG